ncbi:MAG: NBR1-Ig-like domain-containing protein [Anaerolineales bacterium]
MKMKVKLVAVMLSVMLILAAFPVGAGAAHSYACNRAQFIRDVTVPDGSRFAPGDTFTKTWQVRNTGTCTWTKDYELVLTNGDAFGVATTHKLTAPVPPWSHVDLTITDMVAPATPGKHLSYWKLDNGTGERFGVGWTGGVPIFAQINVVTPPSVTYDFTANADKATWSSGAGALTFPGSAGDPNGSVLSQAAPKFENDVTASNPGLLVSPNNVRNGFIQGIYPEYSVKKGDRFQTTVGCEYGQNSCYVAFSLRYQIGSGPIHTLWTFRERYERLTYSANINLDWLAGKNVKFILYMSAYGSPTGDSAIWGHPVIVGSGAPAGPSTSGWSTYSDSADPFTIKFPQGSSVDFTNKTITLPITPGTNLNRKSLEIETSPAGSGDCLSSNPDPSTPVDVTFNEITFKKETGGDGGAGNFQQYVAYSVKDTSESTCVSLTFILSYSAPGNFDPPRPEFNEAAESAVFDTMMSTFPWK